MKYALIKVVNGNFSIVSEHGDNLQAAKVAFHDQCKILWNTPDVITATVMIADSNLSCVEGKIEYIEHATEQED